MTRVSTSTYNKSKRFDVAAFASNLSILTVNNLVTSYILNFYIFLCRCAVTI